MRYLFIIAAIIYLGSIAMCCFMMHENHKRCKVVERRLKVLSNMQANLLNNVEELSKIISAECMQCDSVEKALVGSVVLNRAETEGYPDNIHDVINDKNAFHGLYGSQYVYDPFSYRIALSLLCGVNRNQEVVFFYRRNIAKPSFVTKIIYSRKYHNFGI